MFKFFFFLFSRQENLFELDTQLSFLYDINDLDYDRMFTLTSELIALEVINRTCITIVEVQNMVNFYQTSAGFYMSTVQVFRKHCGKKEKLLTKSNFFFTHSVFYPLGELSAIFIRFKIVVCKVFEFGSLKFVVWERVKMLHFLAFPK